MIVTWAPLAYIIVLVVVVICLAVGHRRGKVDLWDCIRSGKDGVTFTDPRKLFEAGAFVVTTVGFAYLTLLDKMSEAFMGLYMAGWVLARFARDREQRLNRAMEMAKGALPAQPDADADATTRGPMGFAPK